MSSDLCAPARQCTSTLRPAPSSASMKATQGDRNLTSSSWRETPSDKTDHHCSHLWVSHIFPPPGNIEGVVGQAANVVISKRYCLVMSVVVTFIHLMSSVQFTTALIFFSVRSSKSLAALSPPDEREELKPFQLLLFLLYYTYIDASSLRWFVNDVKRIKPPFIFVNVLWVYSWRYFNTF